MKSKFIALLILLSPILASAQTDSKAQEILKSVSAKFKSFKSYKANFTIIIENTKDKSKEVQKGTIYIKGSKYRLEIAGQDVISDGKTRWTYVKDANEVQIDNQKADDNTISPTNIFTIYEKGWQSKYTGDSKDKTITYSQIELIPAEGKNKNVFKIKLSINKADKSIASAKLMDKNGGVQTINVEKISPDGAADDNIFVFNKAKYPGADIVDLR
jgi:outer membrane lipoprotein-sorting protein